MVFLELHIVRQRILTLCRMQCGLQVGASRKDLRGGFQTLTSLTSRRLMANTCQSQLVSASALSPLTVTSSGNVSKP